MRAIIDTHIHIWNLTKCHYSWLEGDVSLLNNNFEIDDLAVPRNQAGVSKGILVQAANNLLDTDLMLQTCITTDWIAGVVGWLPLTDPEATVNILQNKYLANPYFKGCRHLIHTEADPGWLLQPAVLESLKILASLHIPYDLVGVNTMHIITALKVAEIIPDLKMVFDHLNQPPIASREKNGPWHDLMKEAAAHKHFFAKISGLGTASGNPLGWTIEDLQPYIEFAIENFGEDRCFFGGDWPVCLLAGEYTTIWETYKSIVTARFDEQTQQKFFHDNAAFFYNLYAEERTMK